MKILCVLSLLLCSLTLLGQVTASVTDYAIIKGHIKNNKEKMWDLSESTFLDNKVISVPVNSNGDFFYKLKVAGDAMDVFIYPCERMLFLKKNDTLTINWNADDVLNTYTATSANRDRNRTLQSLALLRSTYLEAYHKMQDSLYNGTLTDSAKFSTINEHYNKEIETLIKDGVYDGADKIATDIYFRYTHLLLSFRLLPSYELFIKNPTRNSGFVSVITEKQAYTVESEEWFRLSSDYRDFIFDYIRFSRPFRSSIVMGSGLQAEGKTLIANFAWRDYAAGLNALSVTEIRDWFCTKSILLSFDGYAFNDCMKVYNDFITQVKTPYYADTIKQFYQNIQRLKPGMPAPGFTLKDDNGRMVSLAQFKGKTVYIDFWGVGCGPCIYDIKNTVPALHEMYKDKNIVFINICVDADEPTWKASLKELNLHGINLIAPGWTKHPIAKAYNVNGIPHYYIIGANGKIADNNSPRPSEKQTLYTKLNEVLNIK